MLIQHKTKADPTHISQRSSKNNGIFIKTEWYSFGTHKMEQNMRMKEWRESRHYANQVHMVTAIKSKG
jgi:hypothetical protein